MKIRWNSLGGNIFMRDSELLHRLEMTQMKRQIEVLATFMPDLLLKLPMAVMETVQNFVGVLLFADVSGFTPLCEKYNKTGKGGIYKLTATLNAYIGAIVEVIYFFGGDVLKFSGDAFLALWKADPDDCLFRVIHRVIACALFIQKSLGYFDTEVNVQLKVKLAISCGNMTFSVIGNEYNKHYVILGQAINDVKAAEHASVSGDVVIAPTAWGHVPEESYDVTFAEGGNVKVWRCFYMPGEMAKKLEFDNMYEEVQKLCDRHIKHRNMLHAKRKIDENIADSKLTESFIRSLPNREEMQKAPHKWIMSELAPFIIKPVLEQVDERQPLEYLTEMREVTIQFINIVPTTFYEPKLVAMVNAAYTLICSVVCELLGVVNKVSLFDKDAMILVLFGLRGIKHELESQNALKSGFCIRTEISKLAGVKSVSVGVTNGLVYCGVVGHPLRREYTVIGGSVNKAARIMCAYQGKVTCDHKTYKNSKLSSYYFQLLPELKLKGIEDAGYIFEYNEEFEDRMLPVKEVFPIIGRQQELNFIHAVVNHPETVDNFRGVCFYGHQKMGRSRLLKAGLENIVTNEGHLVASMDLSGGSLRPYFCVSVLYTQLYNILMKIGGNSTASILSPNFADFNDILQNRDISPTKRKLKLTNKFLEILKLSSTGIAVLIVDDIQYIDTRSFDIIIKTLEKGDARLICTGHFEDDTWDTQWKLSLNENIKMLQLEPIEEDMVSVLACQMLGVCAVPKKLVSLLNETCEGRPGWIECCLLRLVNMGGIEIKFTTPEENTDDNNYIFPERTLLRQAYNTELQSNVIVTIADLREKYAAESKDLTLAAISLDLFDSFTPYQQLVIKTGAVLGDIFTRSVLFVILKYPNEKIFANVIKLLFEEDIFECGTRYISTDGLLSKKLVCKCYIERQPHSHVQENELPKYAYCKVIHFKNKNLKTVAYELLPANQRKELHLKITDVLEGQHNVCATCLRDNSAAIIHMKTFREIMVFCNNPSGPVLNTNNILIEHDTEQLKDIIRKHVRDCDNTNKMFVIEKRDSCRSIPTKKQWDPTVCFCLEILTRVCVNLVYHSEKAGHLGKKIFSLTSYGAILITMQEYEDAIPILNEGLELCMIDVKEEHSALGEAFRTFHLARLYILLADAHFRLGNIAIAKNYILLGMRQHNVPIFTFFFKAPQMLLTRTMMSRYKFHIHGPAKQKALVKVSLAISMNLISSILASEGKWDLARMASKKSVYLLKDANPNIHILCDIYSNAIDLYNYCGDTHMCEYLERCASSKLLTSYASDAVTTIYCISRLILQIFNVRFMKGAIEPTVRLGYRCVELNNTVQAHSLQIQVIPLLASTLLLVRRISDAVSLIRILLNIGKTIEPDALVDYYGSCIELYLETSFTLEPIRKCEHFAEMHFAKRVDKFTYTQSEQKLLILLAVYHFRYLRSTEGRKWRNLLHLDKEDSMTIHSIMNLSKFIETLLLSLVKYLELKSNYIDVEIKRVEVYLKQFKTAAKKWRIFMPRYLHYAAYLAKIRSSKKAVTQTVQMAIKVAEKQGNILETSWLRHSLNAWENGFGFGSEVNGIDWRLADSYTTLQWTQLLYTLPSYYS